MSELCDLCNKVSKLNCEFCFLKFCSESHRELHSDQNGKCFPFHIQQVEHVGRYMVTSRDVKAGEILFEEEPIAFGPNQETSPLCLHCLKAVDGSFVCPKCKYPMCKLLCAKSADHLAECDILSSTDSVSQTDYENYHLILPLRILLTFWNEPDRFALTDRLMDHRENRFQDSYWQECEKNVVQILRKNDRVRQEFSEEQIHRIIGILEVNAYEIYSNSCGFGHRGLYPLASLLSHGCVANAAISYDNENKYRAKCIATVDIKKGQEIYSKYVSLITSSLFRRPKLRDCWFFDCTCQRCADPTEMDTMIGERSFLPNANHEINPKSYYEKYPN